MTNLQLPILNPAFGRKPQEFHALGGLPATAAARFCRPARRWSLCERLRFEETCASGMKNMAADCHPPLRLLRTVAFGRKPQKCRAPVD
jgi:hypothetical protein